MSNELELLKKLEDLSIAKSYNKLKYWQPIPKQWDFLNCKAKRKALVAANQIGKANPIYTKILTPDGWTTMGEISVGDKVLCPDGSVANVIGTYPQGVMDIYRIRFNDGTSCESTLDHLWTVKTNKNRFSKKNPRYNQFETWTLGEIIEKWGNFPSRYNACELPIVKNLGLSVETPDIDPWLLGVILGDGSISKSLNITTVDEYIINSVRDICEKEGINLTKYNNSISYGISCGNVKNKPKNTIMIKIKELFGTDTLTRHDKYIPNCYKYSDTNTRISILQGLMDTDGTASKKGFCSFCSTSELLAHDLADIARSLGQSVSVHKKNKFCTYKGERRECICWEVYFKKPTIELFRLPRKLQRQRIFNEPSPRTIVSIEPYGQSEAKCIEIDHPEHLYIIDNYIPTHNTQTLLYELTLHLTGLYPDNWDGVRFSRPVTAWLVGETTERVRDTLQLGLMGDIGRWGTGFLPLKCLDLKSGVTMKPGVPNAVQKILVKSAFGGWSSLQFFSYKQQREDFQGSTIDIVSFDEEPPENVHGECVIRIAVLEGYMLYSFTPLKGQTAVWQSIVNDPEAKYFSIAMDDVPWMNEEKIQKILNAGNYSEMEKRARRYGIPAVGSSQIFKYEEDEYLCDSFTIPDHWPRLGGLDIGHNHPMGAVAIAVDRNSGCVYVYRESKIKGGSAASAAMVLKPWEVEFACSHDAFNGSFALGSKTTADLLKEGGIDTFSAGRDVWARIERVRQLISQGRLWIFRDTCPGLVREMQTYHTKEDGFTIFKLGEDIIDALLHAVHFFNKATTRNERSGKHFPTIPPMPPSSDGYC